MNVYFKETIRDAEGFSSKPYKDGSGDDTRIDGMNLFLDHARLRASFNEDDVVPEKLSEYIDGVSIHDFVSECGRREFGIYKSGTAEATVKYYEGSKRSTGYQVWINAKNLEDARTLLRKIKAGSIRPNESFEGEQQGLSRKELEAELERISAEKDALKLRLSQFTANGDSEKTVKFRQLASELRGEIWPLCLKNGVADRISKILYSAVS